MERRILLVVEGDGDVLAIPLLTRKILHDNKIYDVRIESPAHKRHDIAHLKGRSWCNFDRYLQTAYGWGCPVMWTIDCDDGCALTVAREFSERAVTIGIRQPLAFAFWVREFESLFLADSKAAKSVLGCEFKNLPIEPEQKRGVKEFISSCLPAGRRYSETIEQEKIVSKLDLSVLRNTSRSFRHFEKALLWLVAQKGPCLYPLMQERK
ncbi:DUF4276 family protein [Plasticicumulans sp.]|uniref:DUF4276 family protein n=1 Tax=Plasticicumulans sp. TaxID=2307179 RepID=UPI0032207262